MTGVASGWDYDPVLGCAMTGISNRTCPMCYYLRGVGNFPQKQLQFGHEKEKKISILGIIKKPHILDPWFN